MPKEFSRMRRINELLQHELAILIQRELQDPKLGMITVAAVDVSPDLKTAKVYITTLAEQHSHAEVIEALNTLAGEFRHALSQNVKLRTVPKLQFVYDDSIEAGNRLAALIESVKTKD